jgi:plastocyanin
VKIVESFRLFTTGAKRYAFFPSGASVIGDLEEVSKTEHRGNVGLTHHAFIGRARRERSVMNMMRMGLMLVRLGVLVTAGCASHPPFPESSLTGRIVEVKVGESLSPTKITATQGDEVRWINTTRAPVDLSLDKSLDGIVACQKGFLSQGWGYLFGGSKPDFLVIAKLHGHDHVSLCFSTPGTYTYTVQRDMAPLGAATRLAGTVTIE